MQFNNMYSIYDSAAGAYLAPFFFENDLLAIRAFSTLVNDTNHLFSKEPNDFNLYRFATFDVVEGTLDVEANPVKIRAGAALVKRDGDGNTLVDFEKERASNG